MQVGWVESFINDVLVGQREGRGNTNKNKEKHLKIELKLCVFIWLKRIVAVPGVVFIPLLS